MYAKTTQPRTLRSASPDRDAPSESDPRPTTVEVAAPVPVAGLAYSVGPVDDPAEVAADAMAHRALRALHGAGARPGVSATNALRRSPTAVPDGVGPAGGLVTGPVATALRRLRGAGRPLPATVRAPMEQAFGADFRAVRVHSGPGAATFSHDLGARAFTIGSDIVLGADAADSAQPSVLAHELAHVVQDGAAGGALRRLRAGGEPPTVRRLVGFEVELAAPTFARNVTQTLNPIGTGQQPEKAVDMLLAGSVDYKTEMGSLSTTLGDKITLTSDHDGTMQALGRGFFDAVEAAHPAATAATDHEPLSNLEYGTPAIDELAPGSDAKYRAMADAIDRHAATLIEPAPVTTMRDIQGAMLYSSGLPRAAVRNWLKSSDKRDQLYAAYTALENHVRWFMYVQATVGVLPSGLIRLYQSQAQGLPQSDKAGDAIAVLKDAATAVVDMSKEMVGLPELYELGLSTDEALQIAGILTMAASHAVGRAMLQTTAIGDSEKNAVQLFNKLSSNAAVGMALSSKPVRRLQGQDQEAAVAKMITTAAKAIHQVKQTTAAYWMGPPYRKVASNRGMFYGTSGTQPWQQTAALITDWLTGREKIELFRAGEDGQLHRPDPTPAAIKQPAQDKQQGVPLEMRWITTYPLARGELWPVFQTVLKEVRAANTDQLDERTRKAILAGVRKT